MPDVLNEQPLDQVHRRLEAVLDNATVAIFLMDSRQHCIYMNPAAEELTGFTLREVVAANRPLHDIIHHTHPDGRPFPMADCLIDRAYPEHAKTQGRETFVHKDGHFYPVAFTASPIRDDGSHTIGTVIEVRNIADDLRNETELRLANEANRLLLQEVNHRVKNSLQLVMSLLDIQAGETSDPGARDCLRDARDRVKVVASIHRRLYETQRYDTVEICGYLRDLVESILKSTGKPGLALCFDGCADLVMPISPAVSLALIVSELAMNATKHAFKTGTGTIWVTVNRLDARLCVQVCDDGAGLPKNFSMEQGGSLGMTLIAALADQIGAKVATLPRERGAGFAITMPL